MQTNAFSSLGINQRLTKPRNNGITMVFDNGTGLSRQKDLMELASEYIDLAKIRVGSAALYKESYLKAKINLYKEHSVSIFPGGMFLEYAISHKKTEEFFSKVCQYGFDFVEVSDNVIDISHDEKANLISNATINYKLKVIAEVGSKISFTSIQDIIDDIELCREAGAWKVILEAKEFYDEGKFKIDLLDGICKKVSPEFLIFEVPNAKISGASSRERYSMQMLLVEKLGEDVNLGNIEMEEILVLEAMRRKLEAENLEL